MNDSAQVLLESAVLIATQIENPAITRMQCAGPSAATNDSCDVALLASICAANRRAELLSILQGVEGTSDLPPRTLPTARTENGKGLGFDFAQTAIYQTQALDRALSWPFTVL